LAVTAFSWPYAGEWKTKASAASGGLDPALHDALQPGAEERDLRFSVERTEACIQEPRSSHPNAITNSSIRTESAVLSRFA
jgi:hypothetical protein